jgi:hypothetical protein
MAYIVKATRFSSGRSYTIDDIRKDYASGNLRGDCLVKEAGKIGWTPVWKLLGPSHETPSNRTDEPRGSPLGFRACFSIGFLMAIPVIEVLIAGQTRPTLSEFWGLIIFFGVAFGLLVLFLSSLIRVRLPFRLALKLLLGLCIALALLGLIVIAYGFVKSKTSPPVVDTSAIPLPVPRN